jgi:predicted PurR-regulated permease PerM
MSDARVFTRDRLLTLVLGLLTAISVYICFRIILPFIPAIAFALALCVATRRPYRWLTRHVSSRTVAAGIAVFLAAVLIVGPAAMLLTYIVQMVVDNVSELQTSGGIQQVRQKLESMPLLGPVIAAFTGRFQLEQGIAALGKTLAQRGGDLLAGSVAVLTQLGITLFVLFFLYRDRENAMEALRKLLPLSNEESDRMLERVGSTINATVNGSITVALVQALLAGTIYAILGVPAAVLWGAATFIVALIPMFGAFLVWAPIAAYLALTGSVGKALFLVIWGAAVVGTIDNHLYPHLVGDKLRLHTVPTFFSVLGGISVFGASGLIIGPIVLAITIALIDVWWRRTEHGQAAEEAIPKAAEDSREPVEVLQERGVRH